MIDYAKYPDGDRFYSGAEKKKSILVNGNAYIVKFQKNSPVQKPKTATYFCGSKFFLKRYVYNLFVWF